MTRGAPIPEIVTLHVPFRVVKRGGRKEMQLPDGAVQSRRTDNTLVKALARAFRWKRMLDSGEFTTIAELAVREGIAPSYITRVLSLIASKRRVPTSVAKEPIATLIQATARNKQILHLISALCPIHQTRAGNRSGEYRP